MTSFEMRLKYFRRTNNLTMDQLALASDVSKGYISKLERGVSIPTISTIIKISKALGISVGKLLGEEDEGEQVCLVRKSERKYMPLEARKNSAHAFEALAAKRTVKRMEPFIMRPLMDISEPVDISRHSGDEFMYVIRGRVEVTLNDQAIILSPGDSLYFDATIPHRTRSLGKNPAEMLLITAADAGVGK